MPKLARLIINDHEYVLVPSDLWNKLSGAKTRTVLTPVEMVQQAAKNASAPVVEVAKQELTREDVANTTVDSEAFFKDFIETPKPQAVEEKPLRAVPTSVSKVSVPNAIPTLQPIRGANGLEQVDNLKSNTRTGEIYYGDGVEYDFV